MSLIKNITKTERVYHHQVIPYQNGSLRIKIFSCVYVNVIRSTYFGLIKIEYQVEAPGLEQIELPPSVIDDDGVLDGVYALKDKSQAFEHYLQKFEIICDGIIHQSSHVGHKSK
jgi:formate hydrogenlyase regulatory protein HycA